MLVMEIAIISSAPWFFWVIDAPFKAGITFISEYSLIIFLRLIVVSFLQWSLLASIYNFVSSIINRLLLTIRLLANPTYEFGSNIQSSTSHAEFPERRGVGRPRKS